MPFERVDLSTCDCLIYDITTQVVRLTSSIVKPYGLDAPKHARFFLKTYICGTKGIIEYVQSGDHY